MRDTSTLMSWIQVKAPVVYWFPLLNLYQSQNMHCRRKDFEALMCRKDCKSIFSSYFALSVFIIICVFCRWGVGASFCWGTNCLETSLVEISARGFISKMKQQKTAAVPFLCVRAWFTLSQRISGPVGLSVRGFWLGFSILVAAANKIYTAHKFFLNWCPADVQLQQKIKALCM